MAPDPSANPFLGVFLHSIGGIAAGSFYIPFKKVRRWSWESYWLVGGFFSWIIAPWIVALVACPRLVDTLRSSPPGSLFWSYFFGVLWGIGGLTFGLSMRYLGMSLGYALALGFCALFGTIMPPLFDGRYVDLATKLSGHITVGGILVCLAGIAVCGRAGMRKERELSADQKRASIVEFNFVKGVWVAIFAGVMSACMNFGFEAGKPIAQHAVDAGTPPLFQNFPVVVVVLLGGFTTNFIWCVVLNLWNRSGRDYLSGEASTLAANYVFSALAGITWYLQFMFFSMGKSQMGRYDFSSWTIHMAFIIVFSSLWGIYFREWKGSSRRTHQVVVAGILVLAASTLVIGTGNYMGNLEKAAEQGSVSRPDGKAGITPGEPATSGPAGRDTEGPQRQPAEDGK